MQSVVKVSVLVIESDYYLSCLERWILRRPISLMLYESHIHRCIRRCIHRHTHTYLFQQAFLNSMETCNSVTFYFMKNSFSDISRKWILPNMIRAVNQSQFTPKMKANAVSRLLSSVVWIDLYNMCNLLTALIILVKIHFLLVSENEFFMK